MFKSIRFRRFFGAIAAVLGAAAVAFAATEHNPSGACALADEFWATVTGTNPDGTISSDCQDLASGGLLWSSSALGRTGGGWSYAYAVSGCSDLVEGGYSDWRLPTIQEIQTAVSHDAYSHLSISSTTDGVP